MLYFRPLGRPLTQQPLGKEGRKEGRKEGWGNLGHSSVKGEGRGGCKGIFLAG